MHEWLLFGLTGCLASKSLKLSTVNNQSSSLSSLRTKMQYRDCFDTIQKDECLKKLSQQTAMFYDDLTFIIDSFNSYSRILVSNWILVSFSETMVAFLLLLFAIIFTLGQNPLHSCRHNFLPFMVLVILTMLNFSTQPKSFVKADKTTQRYGCEQSDHQECDEICKQDSYWYGQCVAWDGRDFSCKCFEYRPPLDKTQCINKQQTCDDGCKAQGLEGGYCYVHTVPNVERGAADCKCFEQIPFQ